MRLRSTCCVLLLISTVGWCAEAVSPVDRALAEANDLANAQRHAEAKVAFAKVLALAPDNPEANYHAGLYACDAGEWENALKYEGKAVAADATCARYQYGWGAANGVSALKSGLFSKFGYAKKCLAAYRRAAELEPSNPQYHFALLSYYQQAPGFVGGGMEHAYEEAAAIKKLNPGLGRQAYAQLYVAEKKYDLAFHEYEEAVRSTPPDYAALYSFGRLTLMTSQRLDEGLVALRHCLEHPANDTPWLNSADIHWRIGSVCEKLGKRDDARAEYQAALKENPDFKPAKRSLEKLTAGG